MMHDTMLGQNDMKRDTQKHTSHVGRLQVGQHGFTLVELMIAVGIIAILAAFLAPNVATYMRRAKGTAAASKITNVLRTARNQAMSRGEVIIATVTTRDGVTEGGGTIILERTDNAAAPGCETPDGSAVDMDTTTNPNCFARSCAQAQSMTKTQVFSLDMVDEHPDMIIQGTDPAPAANALTLCFEPSGRVLGTNGLALQSDSSDCDAVNSRIFIRLNKDGSTLAALDDNPISAGNSLSACMAVTDNTSATARQTQKDGRDVANFYSINVPFNGSISARQ
jgi:prepilin-type N-terminal cleavage/methylation domain-containing protein